MKPKMNRSDLLDNSSIWNAVFKVTSESEPTNDDTLLNDSFIISHYYSELESGGHESLVNWLETYEDEISIPRYFNKLVTILDKAGAVDYAGIENKYGKELWRLYKALENDEIKEDEFYTVIEQADEAYNKLENQIEALLEAYFVRIHTDLIDVVED